MNFWTTSLLLTIPLLDGYKIVKSNPKTAELAIIINESAVVYPRNGLHEILAYGVVRGHSRVVRWVFGSLSGIVQRSFEKFSILVSKILVFFLLKEEKSTWGES